MEYRVKKFEDGKYRWLYDLDLRKNLSVLYTTIKVVLISFLVPLVLLMILFAIEGNLINALKDLLPIYFLIGIVLVFITLISYYIVVRYYKGRFSFMFEMDENGVTFKRFGSDAEKTETIGKITSIIGVATNNAGLVGGGLGLAASQTSTSNFSKVRSIKAIPERDLIKINSLFLFNQVYVNKDDYQFVLDYIQNHIKR